MPRYLPTILILALAVCTAGVVGHVFFAAVAARLLP